MTCARCGCVNLTDHSHWIGDCLEALKLALAESEKAREEAKQRARDHHLNGGCLTCLATESGLSKFEQEQEEIKARLTAAQEVVEAALRRRETRRKLDSLYSGQSGKTKAGEQLQAAEKAENAACDRYRASLAGERAGPVGLTGQEGGD